MPTDLNPGDLLTVSQAADILQASPDSVRHWCDLGALASIRTPGGHRRIRRSDVDALVTVPAPAPEEQAK